MRNSYLGRTCAAGLGVVLLAGCGSSSTATAPSPTGSPVPKASPASRPQLTRIVLRDGDLPMGWLATPYKADPNAEAAQSAAMVKCVGTRNTDSGKVAEAHSATFTLNDARISSSAASYRSQKDPDSDAAMLHNPKASSCFQQQLKKQFAKSLPAGVTVKSVTMRIVHGSAGGPSNVIGVGTGTVTIAGNGQRRTLYITSAFITGPLMEAAVGTFNVGKPVSDAVVKSLVTLVANRAATG